MGRLDGDLEVAQVIERIEHADHTDAVFNRLLDESSYHVVGLMRLRDQRLTADQHLQGRFLDGAAQRAQPLPRILLEGAHRGREGPAAPGIERVITDIVEVLGDGQHMLQLEAALHQALLRVAQHGLSDQDPGHAAILGRRIHLSQLDDAGAAADLTHDAFIKALTTYASVTGLFVLMVCDRSPSPGWRAHFRGPLPIAASTHRRASGRRS